MDKAGKIVAAALLAASISQVTPAFSAAMTAEEFVQGLSSDFNLGDYNRIYVKLEGLKNQGFEGVRIDDWGIDRRLMSSLLSVERLMQVLADVRSGRMSASTVADRLRQMLNVADRVVFIAGGYTVAWTDPDQAGHVFPAGSAG